MLLVFGVDNESIPIHNRQATCSALWQGVCIVRWALLRMFEVLDKHSMPAYRFILAMSMQFNSKTLSVIQAARYHEMNVYGRSEAGPSGTSGRILYRMHR